MRIPCPYCGDRDQGEFTYLGDAMVKRPDPEPPQSSMLFHDYVYLRDNPAGWHKEYWYHEQGCRCWLIVERNTLTHEIRSAEFARNIEHSDMPVGAAESKSEAEG
ncbi:MAG: sarcosine oxidase subunit delta [Rhizobiaceae bacterium]